MKRLVSLIVIAVLSLTMLTASASEKPERALLWELSKLDEPGVLSQLEQWVSDNKISTEQASELMNRWKKARQRLEKELEYAAAKAGMRPDEYKQKLVDDYRHSVEKELADRLITPEKAEYKLKKLEHPLFWARLMKKEQKRKRTFALMSSRQTNPVLPVIPFS